MAQLSSVNAIQPVDVNGDGHPDLVIGGNENGFATIRAARRKFW